MSRARKADSNINNECVEAGNMMKRTLTFEERVEDKTAKKKERISCHDTSSEPHERLIKFWSLIGSCGFLCLNEAVVRWFLLPRLTERVGSSVARPCSGVTLVARPCNSGVLVAFVSVPLYWHRVSFSSYSYHSVTLYIITTLATGSI